MKYIINLHKRSIIIEVIIHFERITTLKTIANPFALIILSL